MTKIIKTIKSYQLKHLNIRLLVWVVALNILGLNVIASATSSDIYEKKQLFGIFLGLTAMVFTALISYNFILKFYWLFYIINLGLLLCVKFFGSNKGGATRWIDLGFMQLQPSEFTKLFLILFFAKYIYKYKDRLNTLPVLGGAVVLFVIPLALVLKQPDLSTSIVISFVFCGIMYIGNISYKIVGSLFAASIPIIIILVYLILQPNQKILDEYQYNRLVGFYDENSEIAKKINYQQDNSIMAIGSGGLWGKGLNNNTTTSVKNGNYISEPQTDFIFCIVGEELGFIGSTSVIILLLLIVFECFYVGAHASNLSGRIIAASFGVLIAFQSFVNIGVVTRLLPNTGLPLPFVSYGISSLLSLYIGIGVVLNIGMQRKNTI